LKGGKRMRMTMNFYFEYFGIKYLFPVTLIAAILYGVFNFDFLDLNGYVVLNFGLYSGYLAMSMYIRKSL